MHGRAAMISHAQRPMDEAEQVGAYIPDRMSSPLAAFSASLSRLVAAAAPLLTAVRTGPNRHVTGLLTWNDTIVTTDQALPAQDHYTVVLPSGELAGARPGPRDTVSNIAALRLDVPVAFTQLQHGSAPLGGLMVILAADHDASPTVRLTVVHRLRRINDGVAPAPDLAPHQIDQGAAALDAEGRLIGVVSIGPAGEAIVVPNATIRQAFQAGQAGGPPDAAPRPVSTAWSPGLARCRAATHHRAGRAGRSYRSDVWTDGGEHHSSRAGRTRRPEDW